MEEPDFITRQHLDSLVPCNDPSTFELLNRYKDPPVEVNPPQPPQQPFLGSFPVAVHGNNDVVMLGHMIGQLQGTLQNQNQGQSKSNFDGLSLNVNSDILRWVILFIFLALLVWVIFIVQKKLRANPADERLERIEKQLRRLKRHRSKRKKNPRILQDEDDDPLAFDDPFEDDVEEFDLLED